MKNSTLIFISACFFSARAYLPPRRHVRAESRTASRTSAKKPGRHEARERLVEEVTRAWEKEGGRSDLLRFVVLDCDARGRAYRSELRQLFPEGTRHLPEPLVARGVYSTLGGGGRRVQYLGKAERGGFKFALFRLVEGAADDSRK